MRSVTRPEFEMCAGNLSLYGNFIKVRVPRSAKQVDMLVKKTPSVWPDDALCSQEDFNGEKKGPVNALITVSILQAFSYTEHYNADD